jgi:uncharacterized protein
MRRRLFVLVLALLAIAAPALAHVEVKPEEAERGSTTTFTFSVPNEEDAAKTVKVEIFFPEGATFSTVTPGPVTGWTAKSSKTSVVWSGGTISGEDEVEFPVTLGPVPSAGDDMIFKALQTYDNGEVVRWIDIQTGSEEPPHPAPVVKLTGTAPTTSEVVVNAPPTTAAPKPDKSDDGVNSLPVIFLAIATFFAAVGIGIGIGVFMRRGRAT